MSGVFAGRRYAVVGLGRNGTAAAAALRGFGAQVDAWDDNDGATHRPQLQGRFVYDALVLSPGVPHALPRPHPAAVKAREAGVPILCDAELLFEAVRASGSRARFIGVTGTNGKSTTTALVEHILSYAGRKVAAGGNLGPAALALPMLGDDGIYVLEMSSYMLERLATLRFDAAAVLNISPDHLDRHGDMAGYVAAKRAIFNRRDDAGRAVIGIDDDFSRALADAIPGAVRVSGSRPADVWCDGTTLLGPDGFRFDMRDAPALPGAHNAQNAAAAVALCADLPAARLAAGLLSFPGLPHRQQRVGSVDGVLYVNDSKATNADAAAHALACYDRVTWIAGGVAKAGGIESLAPLFSRVARALLIGRDAPVLAETLRTHGVPHEVVGTLEAAVAAARAGDAPVVLLSPACASFDQFSGFEARGERFMQLVRELR
jgi:UDP-N-acetylmuramoylalanine--D-glutamate ligase